MRRIIVDTGPLVALLNAHDRYHDWTKETLNSIEPPLLTCESVLSEACFLVRHLKGGRAAILELVERGIVRTAFSIEQEISSIRKLVGKYESVPMSLADACLVRMIELNDNAVLLTLDADFRIYRRNGRQTIPLITPD